MLTSRKRQTLTVVFGIASIWMVAMVVWYHGAITHLDRWVPWTASPSRHGDDGAGNLSTAVDYENAHKLPSPDAFATHFTAVTSMPGISVAEAKRTCTWEEADQINFQFDENVDWAQEDRSDSEIALHRHQWRDFILHDKIPYSRVKDKFRGRGIVILSGNPSTIPRVGVVLRALRKLGSTLPIEFHYWDNEMDKASMDQLASFYTNVSFNDLSGDHNILRVKKDRFLINYQLKTAAVVNSRFAELLLLDTDNIPVIDPALLFESKTYQEFGTIFWPDIARTRPQNPSWAISNTPCRMNEYEQESGQLLVDKRRFWYHLQLSAWWNNAQGVYFDEFLLGDKDTFRFAWHALRTRYGQPKKWLTSVGTLNDGFYCGHSFAQHHPDDDRVAFLHGGLTKTVSLEVLKWNREVKGGYYRHYKRSVDDERPEKITTIGIKFDGADYMPNHSEEFRSAFCTDMYDTEARDLNEIVPGFEARFEEMGGYWQLDGAK